MQLNRSVHNYTAVTTVGTRNLLSIKVPEFSGKFSDLKAYMDRFLASADSADMSPSDKCTYLITNIRGRSFEIINRYKPTAANLFPSVERPC